MSYSLTDLHKTLVPCRTAAAAAEYGMRYVESLDWKEKADAKQDLRHYMTVQTGVAIPMPTFRAVPAACESVAEAELWPVGSTHWRCTFTRAGKRMSVAYHMGSAHTDAPCMWDVLSCLFSDAESAGESFESWASDLGYDTDSRKAEATYKACQSIAKRLHALFGDDFETFRELSRDV